MTCIRAIEMVCRFRKNAPKSGQVRSVSLAVEMILHPNKDTPELRAMAPDWEARVDDYEVFRNPALREAIKASGVHVIGMRALRDAMRG